MQKSEVNKQTFRSQITGISPAPSRKTASSASTPPGNRDKGSDQPEEQAGPESLVHDNADQEDQERGVDVQQACPSGLIYTVER